MSYVHSPFKRVFDLLLAVPLAIVALPLAALVALFVLATLGPPVLFRQRRPGRGGETFVLVKFRSMSRAVDPDGRPLPDAERLGRFGRLLRRSSLDELPELYNVLRGDMSLVGPRPLLTCYLERYTPRQARRHEVRPGLTGWAVVQGRNAIDWPQRLELDVWYVENASLWLDAKILAMTVLLVLSGRGVAAGGEASMSEFRGGAEPGHATTDEAEDRR